MSVNPTEVLDEFVGRLRDALPALDEEIADLEAQLAEKRATRKQTAQMIRLRDPEFEADKRSGPKTKPHTGPVKPVADEKLAAIRAFIESHSDDPMESGDGTFTASSLCRHEDWNGLGSQATASAALRLLHDRGVIELHHIGTGGAKHFVVAR